MQDVHRRRHYFTNLAKLDAIGLVLPVHTSDIERLFSLSKRVKTPLRNRINRSSLQRIIRLCLDGDCLQFAAAAAVVMGVVEKPQDL